MKKVGFSIFHGVLLAALIMPVAAFAVDFPTTASNAPAARAGVPTGGIGFLSQYGQIQNVQSYSSNPFFDRNSPYNQRMPVPVYVEGAELTAAECRAAVASVIAMQCGMQNNCVGKRLMDIRPYVIQSLSALPGHNYVSACGGFMDAVFNDYMAQSTNLGAAAVTFPTATSAPNRSQPEFRVDNPFEPEMSDFKKGVLGRMVELNQLQAQTADDTTLVATDMPRTWDDLTFTEKNAIMAADYQNWECDPATGRGCAYMPAKVETDLEKFTRESGEYSAQADMIKSQEEMVKSQQNIQRTTDFCGWCRDNANTCFMELGTRAAEQNKTLQDAACAARAVASDQWHVIADGGCGYKLDLKRDDLAINDDICGRRHSGAGPAAYNEKESNYCTWCLKNITECVADRHAQNATLIRMACGQNPRPTETLIFDAGNPGNCTNSPNVMTSINDIICRGTTTSPGGGAKTNPGTGCAGNAQKCSDGTCPESHPNKACPASWLSNRQVLIK